MTRHNSTHTFQLLASLLLVASAAACDPAPSTAPTAELAAGTGSAEPEPEPGRYIVRPIDVALEPADCRIKPGGDGEGIWSLELPLPLPLEGADAEFQAAERYSKQPRANVLECSRRGAEFSCSSEAGFDYRTVGTDANVTMTGPYEGAFDSDESFAGTFELHFECKGSACAQVAEQWTVTQFPCVTRGRMAGTLSDG